VKKLLFLALVSFFATVHAEMTDGDRELLNVNLHRAAALIEISQTASSFIKNLGLQLSKDEVAFVGSNFKPVQPGTPVSVSGKVLTFTIKGEAKTTLEFLNPMTGEVTINGKKFKFNKSESLKENVERLQNEIQSVSGRPHWMIQEANAVVPVAVSIALSVGALTDLLMGIPCAGIRYYGQKQTTGYSAPVGAYLSCIATPLNLVGIHTSLENFKAYRLTCPQEDSGTLTVRLTSDSNDQEIRTFSTEQGKLTGVKATSLIQDNFHGSTDGKHFYSFEYEPGVASVNKVIDKRGDRDIVLTKDLIDADQKRIAASLAGDFNYYSEICKDEKRLTAFRINSNKGNNDSRTATDVVPKGERGTR